MMNSLKDIAQHSLFTKESSDCAGTLYNIKFGHKDKDYLDLSFEYYSRAIKNYEKMVVKNRFNVLRLLIL